VFDFTVSQKKLPSRALMKPQVRIQAVSIIYYTVDQWELKHYYVKS